MDRVAMGRWAEERRDVWLDLLRIYMGVALFLKGVDFIAHSTALMRTISSAEIPFSAVLLVHYIVCAHIAGGLMLAFGVLTRVAAAVQLPIVLGAIYFVHRREELFSQGHSLEFTLLVLFVLVLLTVSGSGRLSVDHYRKTTGYAPPAEALAV